MFKRRNERSIESADTENDLDFYRRLCGEEEDPEEPPFDLLIQQVRGEVGTDYPSYIIAQSVAESKDYPTSTYKVNGIQYLRVHVSPSIFIDYPM